MPIAPYAMPPGPHARRHGPSGYVDYGSYKAWLRDEFQFRCVFCLSREKRDKQGWRNFRIDHIVPQSLDPTKITLYDNLLYVCSSCNEFKASAFFAGPMQSSLQPALRFCGRWICHGVK